MAKKRRNVVGSILKAKDGGTDYIKMRDGKTYKLESKKSRLESLNKAVEDGKLTEEVAAKVREGIEKIPSWVRFEIVEFVDVDNSN